MDEYVSKPINAPALFAAIDRVLAPTLLQSVVKTESAAPMMFEYGALLEVANGETALASELAELFLADGPAHMLKISAAIDSGDASNVQFAAHALKGSAGSLTARGVAGTAGRLEAMGVAGDLGGAEGAFAELVDEMAALVEALEPYAGSTALLD